MKIEKDIRSSRCVKIGNVNCGVVFHLAQDLFDDAVENQLFFMRIDVPPSCGRYTIINIFNGVVTTLNQSVNVTPRKSKCIVSKDIDDD